MIDITISSPATLAPIELSEASLIVCRHGVDGHLRLAITMPDNGIVILDLGREEVESLRREILPIAAHA